MGLAIGFGIVVGVLAAREVTRALVAGEFRIKAIVALRTPGSRKRRALTITAGIVVMYLAIATVAFAYATRYGFPTGKTRFAVGDVIAGGAAEGTLAVG